MKKINNANVAAECDKIVTNGDLPDVLKEYIDAQLVGQLPLCTFEQAQALSALNFNCKTLYYYFETGALLFSHAYDYNSLNNCYSAPTVSQALKWLRDEFQLFGFIRQSEPGRFDVVIQKFDRDMGFDEICLIDALNYEKAENYLLDTFLKRLER